MEMYGWSQLCKSGLLVYEQELGQDRSMTPGVQARIAQEPVESGEYFLSSLPSTYLAILSPGWSLHSLLVAYWS